MADDDGQRLAAVMAAIAAGDRAAVFALVEEFEGPLRAAARRAAVRLGVRATAEEEAELAMEVALALVDVAGSWRPDGGALPWVWAERRVARAVGRWVGQHADPLEVDLEAAAPVAAAGDVPPRAVVEAATHPGLRSVAALADAIGWERVEVLLEVELQRAAGDPSPAVTVAALTGRRPDAVRQIVSRAKAAARRLVEDDPELAGLAGSRLVA